MKVFLVDLNKDLVSSWQKEINKLNLTNKVEAHNKSILDIQADALVSPANSYGYMRGGIDGFYTRTFGTELEKRVRDKIKKEYNGKLPVGKAISVELPGPHNYSFKYLISAPTMQEPGTYLVGQEENIYKATKAAIKEAKKLGIKSIAIPGMGTGVGGISPSTAAKLMVKAISELLNE